MKISKNFLRQLVHVLHCKHMSRKTNQAQPKEREKNHRLDIFFLSVFLSMYHFHSCTSICISLWSIFISFLLPLCVFQQSNLSFFQKSKVICDLFIVPCLLTWLKMNWSKSKTNSRRPSVYFKLFIGADLDLIIFTNNCNILKFEA